MSTSTNVDTNIDNYTISELLTILDLENLDDMDQVVAKTNYYIQQFDKENNSEMSGFFHEIQDRLTSYIEDPDNDPEAKQTNNWYVNENLKQGDPVQADKVTRRKQKIDVYNNQHVPMNREQLGVNNTFAVPVAQDSLNPNLENVTSRFINLDSQYRQPTGGVESSSTDYTLDLSEPLNNVLSMRMYSIQIPYAWYTIDTVYGNTCFWLVFASGESVSISVEPGNYTPEELLLLLNTGVTGFKNPDFKYPTSSDPSGNYPIRFNANNGKVTIQLANVTYKNMPIDGTTQILFYDITAKLTCGTSNCNQTNTINQTLGWVMGYRLPYVYMSASGNKADALIELYGPKYLILALDDYNQNHINNGLITITEMSKNVKLPSYYNPTLPQTCSVPNTNISGLVSTIPANNGDLLAEKIDLSYKKVSQVLPTAPRLLTQAQIYSINEIMKNNEKNTNYRSKAPANSDTFALIPIKHSSTNQTGDMYIEFGGSLQDNKRIYFGPVNIDRLRVKLYDDKGNIINMNGADWSFTIIADILYQY